MSGAMEFPPLPDSIARHISWEFMSEALGQEMEQARERPSPIQDRPRIALNSLCESMIAHVPYPLVSQRQNPEIKV
jgi:hypothetical protein